VRKIPKKAETPFDCLALALALADANDFEGAWKAMGLSQGAAIALEDDCTFNALYGAAAIKLAWLRDLRDLDSHELTGIHARLVENLPYLLPEAKIVSHPSSPACRPDFWFEVAGGVYPVEVRKASFGSAAVKQLRRYMAVYETAQGYAVAPKLTTDLDEGMVFIKCK